MRAPLLIAISGIDASGKGTLAARMSEGFRRRGLTVATIGLDPWQAPWQMPQLAGDVAAHFYEAGFRFDALFAQLVDPLRQTGSIELDVELRDHAGRAFAHRYAYRDVDVVVLEGIFLFKRELRQRYDLSIWVDCDYPTALRRAFLRNQEGLPPDRLRAHYERIYFPAQEIHRVSDDPRGFADLLVSKEVDREEMAPSLSKFL